MDGGYSEREKKEYLRLRTARRTMTYVVRTMLLVTAGVLVCALAFFTAERASNLYILTSEGMALRAECILGDGEPADMEEYFLLAAISRDEALADTRYDNYVISGYNYDLSIEKISVLPWTSTATITAVETMTVRGAIKPEMIEEGKTSSDYPPPEWTSTRYKIHFINTGERWYISELETVEENPSVAPLRTPDLSADVLPMATPTPTPEAVELK